MAAQQENTLILMVDQLNGTLFPDGSADFLHTPKLRKLADRSVRFAKSYTASPPMPTICAVRGTRPAYRARCTL